VTTTKIVKGTSIMIGTVQNY